MKVLRKLTMTDGQVFYKFTGTTEWAFEPTKNKKDPVFAISEDMYLGKKEPLPVAGIFDSIISKLHCMYSEIISVEED